MGRRNIAVGVLAIAALLLGVVGWLFLYDPPYRGSLKAFGRPLVFGHRGFGYYAPDNSLAGAKLSMAAKVDGVDMDGQITADGALVIFHDLSVDRLTGGTGRVTAHTLPDLRRLDLGAKYGKGFEGKPDSFVATFEDFLAATQGKGILMVELKVPGLQHTGIEEKAVDLVRRHAAFKDVFLSSFNPVVLYRLKKLEPRIHTVFIFMDTNWNQDLLAEIKPGDQVNLPFFVRSEPFRRAIRKLVQPDALSVNITVDEETIRALLEKGQPIFLWTPEKREAIEKALRMKPFGVISDEPTMAKEIRDQLYPGMIPALHDPAVALTDGFLAVECAVLSVALRRDPLRAGAFAALGASSLFGGLTHGFFPAEAPTAAGLICWLATLSCLGLAAACFWLVAFELWPLPATRRRAATTFIGIAWVAYEFFIVLVDHRFLVGVAFYLPPLLFLGVALARRVSRGSNASAPGLLAIGLMLLGSALQQAGIDLLPEFNHNALYHLVQAIALPMLFVSLRPPPASQTQ